MKKIIMLVMSIMLSIILVGCDESPIISKNAYETNESVIDKF